ncbi:MAG: helix-turn-helix domain-containing protein [Gemmataceae bacterium]|nr:helix-turn-helix domain-containing protein [Gemmataceae bacterium]
MFEVDRRGSDPEQRLRANILRRLGDGVTWVVIAEFLDTSTATINRWRKCYLEEGTGCIAGRRRWRASVREWWLRLAWREVLEYSPTRFGFVRSRYSGECVALVLKEDDLVRVRLETVRRRLWEANLVWRRPRPVLGPKDPAHAVKLGKIRKRRRKLSADHVAVVMDEVDVNTNPKIGSAWMRRRGPSGSAPRLRPMRSFCSPVIGSIYRPRLGR